MTGGKLAQDCPVALNRLITDYDHLLICGPVFPHEVAGFSGGSKYFFPGIGGAHIIAVTAWLGGLAATPAPAPGLYAAPQHAPCRAAADLSANTHIVRVKRPFRRALAVMPEMYS